jgi:hypothetical protein
MSRSSWTCAMPLFNGTSGPAAVIDVGRLTRALAAGAPAIRGYRLPPDAPPAFLLDSRRNEPATPPAPGAYDNRWVVLAQDFPSGCTAGQPRHPVGDGHQEQRDPDTAPTWRTSCDDGRSTAFAPA